jgi:hypothetical protein
MKRERSVSLTVIGTMMLVYSIICFSYNLFIAEVIATGPVWINQYYLFLTFLNINGLICLMLSLKVLQLKNWARTFTVFYSIVVIILLGSSFVYVLYCYIFSTWYRYPGSNFLTKHILLHMPIFIVFPIYFGRSKLDEQFSPPSHPASKPGVPELF